MPITFFENCISFQIQNVSKLQKQKHFDAKRELFEVSNGTFFVHKIAKQTHKTFQISAGF
jgi:hypothetical protein